MDRLHVVRQAYTEGCETGRTVNMKVNGRLYTPVV